MKEDTSIESVEIRDQTVLAEFSNQPAFAFHGLWLRDSCDCCECIHSENKQKRLSAQDIPGDIRPVEAETTRKLLRSCYMERDTLHSSLRILAGKLGDPLQNAIFTPSWGA
jgi:hypothetical protein